MNRAGIRLARAKIIADLGVIRWILGVFWEDFMLLLKALERRET